jgi:hypothetical protein
VAHPETSMVGEAVSSQNSMRMVAEGGEAVCTVRLCQVSEAL